MDGWLTWRDDATVRGMDGLVVTIGLTVALSQHHHIRRPQGAPKGDASIAYVRPESVELAIEILNGGLLRPNCPVTISKGP